MKWVDYGSQAQEPPGKPSAPVIPPARQSVASSVPLAQPSQVKVGMWGEKDCGLLHPELSSSLHEGTALM